MRIGTCIQLSHHLGKYELHKELGSSRSLRDGRPKTFDAGTNVQGFQGFAIYTSSDVSSDERVPMTVHYNVMGHFREKRALVL